MGESRMEYMHSRQVGTAPGRKLLRPLSATTRQSRSGLARPSSATTRSHSRGISSSAAIEFYETHYNKKVTVDDRGETSKVLRKQRPQSAKVTSRNNQTEIPTRIEEQHVHGGRMKRPQSAASMRRSTSATSLNRPKSAKSMSGRQTKQPHQKVGYEYLKKREQGWDSGFVRLNSLDATAAVGSGLRAVRKRSGMRKTQSEATFSKPLRYGGPTKTKRKKKTQSKFKLLCKNIVKLWEELHIPTRDRDFFYESYCTKAKPDPETAARVRDQYDLLLKHRETTVAVLELIQHREEQLVQLRRLSVEQVCSMNNNSEKGSDGNGDGEPASSEDRREETHNSNAHDDVGEDEGTKDDDASSRLSRLIRELRETTIEIVQAINLWRTFLWRPHPFVWQGMNYLVKMQSDARFYGKTVDKQCKDTILFVDSSFESSYNTVEDQSRLDDIRNVINEEARVQCELRAEHKRLIAAGYYIPMLRWSPEDPAGKSSRTLFNDEDQEEGDQQDYDYDEDHEEQ